MIRYRTFVLLAGYETNTYLVWDELSCEAILIDPASPSDFLNDFIYTQGITVKYVVNTHGHADHIGGNDYFKHRTGAKVCIHGFDSQMLSNADLNLSKIADLELSLSRADKLLEDNQVLQIGEYKIRVIHTPGHTKGSVCLYVEPHLFSGDTLFYRDIGRCDLPGGNEMELHQSIKNNLFTLPDNTVVLPGHGPESSITDEKLLNPYLRD